MFLNLTQDNSLYVIINNIRFAPFLLNNYRYLIISNFFSLCKHSTIRCNVMRSLQTVYESYKARCENTQRFRAGLQKLNSNRPTIWSVQITQYKKYTLDRVRIQKHSDI